MKIAYVCVYVYIFYKKSFVIIVKTRTESSVKRTRGRSIHNNDFKIEIKSFVVQHIYLGKRAKLTRVYVMYEMRRMKTK